MHSQVCPAIVVAVFLAAITGFGQITDGSFEAGTVGGPPGPAWSLSPGAVAEVRGSGLHFRSL